MVSDNVIARCRSGCDALFGRGFANGTNHRVKGMVWQEVDFLHDSRMNLRFLIESQFLSLVIDGARNKFVAP